MSKKRVHYFGFLPKAPNFTEQQLTIHKQQSDSLETEMSQQKNQEQ